MGEPNATFPRAHPFALFVRASLMIKYVTMRLRSVSVAFRNVLPAKLDLPPSPHKGDFNAGDLGFSRKHDAESTFLSEFTSQHVTKSFPQDFEKPAASPNGLVLSTWSSAEGSAPRCPRWRGDASLPASAEPASSAWNAGNQLSRALRHQREGVPGALSFHQSEPPRSTDPRWTQRPLSIPQCH